MHWAKSYADFLFVFAGMVPSLISTWSCLWSWAAEGELFPTNNLVSKLAFGKSFQMSRSLRVKQRDLSRPNLTVTHSLSFICPVQQQDA